MELEGRHFRAVAQRKGALLLTVAAQTVILPALGFGLAHVMALPPHISAGILLIAACPVGDIANFYTRMARANVALSVSVNTLSILLSAATMAVAAAVFIAFALLAGLTFGRLLRLSKGDGVTVGIGFAVRNVALAMAIAVTILNRIEYAVFVVVYSLTEVPVLLGAAAVYRTWRTQAVQWTELPGAAR